jgi:hypothetical protein
MQFNFCLDVSLDNIDERNGIREKAGEANITKLYATIDETSRWIPNGCYTSLAYNLF